MEQIGLGHGLAQSQDQTNFDCGIKTSRKES
jgi:hypothetical protein